jgi:asparagine synthase (glutamine-hydrolysing)
MFHCDPHAPVDAGVVRAMARALAHRGPDGEGFRSGPGYLLGHRRLAIVDIAGGDQPMADASGRVWVTFNGEIYNHLELRAQLEARGHRFATRCDTEVLVNGYREWGERLPERLRGMFAFAIVDEERQLLFAARDRLGKKPFHYAVQGERLVFASELKAFAAVGDLPRAVCPRAIVRFLCLRYVPDPDTIFADIAKLPPGHSLTFAAGRLEVRPYWRLSFAEPSRAPAEELAERVRATLDEAVRLRLMGEVPLGAFLSGGVDSHAVTESMRRASPGKVVACTIGFEEAKFDERPWAREAAAACNAELHEEVVRPAEMIEQEWFADTFDEPFADDSAVPTWHVSRLARRHVTVALAGDGGDECFAGYRRYRFDVWENRARGLLPGAIWRTLGGLYPKADFLPRWLRFKRTLQNLARPPAEAYARSVSGNLPENVLPLLREDLRAVEPDPLAPLRAAYARADGPDPLARAIATDFATYLPGDILTKVDRASMANSLEVRAPFLDHCLVELAASVPSALKLRGGQKGFLRAALRPRVGAAADRRKQGFSTPLRQWFRGPLGEALRERLAGGRLRDVVDVARVEAQLAQHRGGLADHGQWLWSLLVLGRFLDRWAR